MNSTQEFDHSLGRSAQAVIGLATDFAEKEVKSWIETHGGERRWAGDLIRRASGLCLAGIEVPVDQGGHGLPYGARARVAEELAKTDFAFAFAFINHHNAALRIAADGNETARAKYVPEMLAGKLIGCTAMSELDAGSDFSAIRTFAKKVDGGWLLDGEKRWIANAQGGEIALVFAQTDRLAGPSGIACFIVDLRDVGCSRLQDDQIEGLALAGIGGFRLEAYRASDCDLLYPAGVGFSQAMAGVNKARTHIAAMASGLLFASLRAATARAASRVAFGRPIMEQQGLRWSLVDVSMTLEIMQMLTVRAARLIQQGSDEAVVAAAMAKKFAAEQCLNGISACIQAFGAAGLVQGNGLSSRLIAAKALCMADGTTEMMNERIGASLNSRVAHGATAHASSPTVYAPLGRAFKAIRLEQTTGKKTVATIAEFDVSDLPAGEVLVRINYSTVNYKDALAITGKSPVVKSFPMIPGIDFAGTVEESTDPRYRVGDEVLLNGWGVGESHWGGLSQRARVRGDWLIPLPPSISSRQAMCIGTAGYSAMLCVMTLEARGVMPESGSVLVTGANGGVGSIAISLLARLGYSVTASTGRLDESEHLKKLGANAIIDRRLLSEPGRPLQKESWAGAVDAVGSHTLVNVLAGTRYGGTVAACGLAQGMDLPGTMAPFILRGVSLAGVDSVYVPVDRRKEAWRRLSSELPMAVVEANTREVALDEAIALAPALLAGQVRGRLLVNLAL